jgi:PAS domain S-box-containing protein
MDHGRKMPTRGNSVSRTAPFAGAVLLGFLLLPLPPHGDDEGPIIAAAILFGLLTGAVWLSPWNRLPGWSRIVPPLVGCVVIVLLRHGAGGADSGLAPLALLPVIWLSLYGTRIELAIGVAASVATLAIPLLIFGQPEYPPSEWTRVVLWAFLGTMVGLAVQPLVAKVRQTAALAADQAEQLRMVVESMSDGLVVSDADAHFRIFNSEAEKILGFGALDVAPSEWSQDYGLFLPDTVTPVSEDEYPLIRALKGESVENMDMFVRNPHVPDGKWITVSGRPLRGRDGSITGSVVVFADVTARREAAREREIAREQAIEASRLKSEFLASMSHEVRTPLNGVIGMTELLLDTKLTEEQREYTRMLRDSGEALLDIVNDILDLSKIEAGKIELESATFDLRETIEDVCDLLAKRAHDKGLELTLAIGEDVPFAVQGDKARLRQVVVNLISNAVKFTSEGEVRVAVSATPQGVRVEVTDTGIGIDGARIAQLFEPFSQADRSTTRRFGGTGLGLTISKQLVELMGGDIGATGTRGEGSTFWFSVPLVQRPGVSRASDRLGPVAEMKGTRILIVDDNATNREVLTAHARAWELRADTAADADGALTLMRRAVKDEDAYAIAVVDFHMPGMDGAELARAIMADDAMADTALIMVSSAGHPLGGETASLFTAQIRKPVRRSRLHEAITRALNGDGAADEVADRTLAHQRPKPEGARLLVAEDNEVNQMVVARMLEKQGFRPVVVADGQKALAALEAEHFDAVLMDCHMPEMDGYEATRRLRRREGDDRHTPVIAMTASAMEGDRQMCIAAGMDDYITKPLEPDYVLSVLARWVGEANGAQAVFDPAKLDDIRTRLDASVVTDIARLFLADAPKRITAIRSADDAEALRATAHALRGGAGTVGAVRMAELSAKLEELAIAGTTDGAQPLIEELEEAFRTTKQDIENRFDLT